MLGLCVGRAQLLKLLAFLCLLTFPLQGRRRDLSGRRIWEDQSCPPLLIEDRVVLEAHVLRCWDYRVH